MVFSATGSIDMLTGSKSRQRTDAVLARQPAALIIDLLRVEFLGSVGIEVLVNLQKTIAAIPFAVVAHGAITSRPLHLLRIDTIVEIDRERRTVMISSHSAPPQDTCWLLPADAATMAAQRLSATDERSADQ